MRSHSSMSGYNEGGHHTRLALPQGTNRYETPYTIIHQTPHHCLMGYTGTPRNSFEPRQFARSLGHKGPTSPRITLFSFCHLFVSRRALHGALHVNQKKAFIFFFQLFHGIASLYCKEFRLDGRILELEAL